MLQDGEAGSLVAGGAPEGRDMLRGRIAPKFEDQRVGEYLAFTGAVKDDILDVEHLAMRLLEVLRDGYLPALCARYNLVQDELEGRDGYDLLEAIGRKRGMLMAGGHVNTERAAITVLDEFRSGTIGRITLERVPT